MADDLYIELLRYGKKHLADGVTIKEAQAHLDNLYPKSAVVESLPSFTRVFDQVFRQELGGSEPFVQYFTMEGYFHLLEHEELKQARRSSNIALGVAIAAIIISIFVQLAPSAWLPWTSC